MKKQSSNFMSENAKLLSIVGINSFTFFRINLIDGGKIKICPNVFCIPTTLKVLKSLSVVEWNFDMTPRSRLPLLLNLITDILL